MDASRARDGGHFMHFMVGSMSGEQALCGVMVPRSARVFLAHVSWTVAARLLVGNGGGQCCGCGAHMVVKWSVGVKLRPSHYRALGKLMLPGLSISAMPHWR